MTNTITPNAVKNLRKVIKAEFAELRGDCAKVRSLRSTGRFLDKEEAEEILEFLVHHKHKLLQDRIRYLNSVQVVKYSNLSPTAAEREERRRNT